MSLRVKLFLLFGGLLVLLVAAEWWLVRTFAKELSGEVGNVAFKVSESMFTAIATPDSQGATPAPPPIHAWRELRGTRMKRTADGEAQDFTMFPPHATFELHGQEHVTDVLHVGGQHPVALGNLTPEELEALTAAAREALRKAGWTEVTTKGSEDEMFNVVLSVDSAVSSRYLKLGGPGMAERHIPIPRDGVEEAMDGFLNRLFGGSVALLVAGLLAAGVIAHRTSAPLRRLATAAGAVGAGELGTRVQSQEGGEVGAAIHAFNDMSTQLKDLDDRTRALTAERHLTELGEVARGLAHGLRNPLNAIGLSLEEIAERPEDERRELAATARRQIKRIDQSIRSFLALASAQQAADQEDVNVSSLAREVALEVLQDSRERVHINFESDESDLVLRAVPAELRAAFQALMVNAVEASPQDGTVTVSLDSSPEGGATLRVADDGKGIPSEVRQRLFTPHVTTKSSGSGMGLFLAHRIATTRHGGSLELLDRDTGGTEAVLQLRCDRMKNDA